MKRGIHVQGYFHDGSKTNNIIIIKRKVKESIEIEREREKERGRERVMITIIYILNCIVIILGEYQSFQFNDFIDETVIFYDF